MPAYGTPISCSVVKKCKEASSIDKLLDAYFVKKWIVPGDFAEPRLRLCHLGLKV